MVDDYTREGQAQQKNGILNNSTAETPLRSKKEKAAI